jgi:5-methylcytosine-specific restriction enzyme subunit McrC
MATTPDEQELVGVTGRSGEQPMRVGKIPVKNLFVLLLYASDLYQKLLSDPSIQKYAKEVEESNDIAELIATMLCYHLSKRLRQNPSYQYRRETRVLNRVRGRIDIVGTFSNRLLERGQVLCNYEQMSADSPRNRYLRAALQKLAKMVGFSSTDRARKCVRECWRLDKILAGMGIKAEKPLNYSVRADRFGRCELGDRLIMSLAGLAFDCWLLSEISGDDGYINALDRGKEHSIRSLFEKAVEGFYKVRYEGRNKDSDTNWKVNASGSKEIKWPAKPLNQQHEQDSRLIPGMTLDIILENKECRIIIDTKFTAVDTEHRYGKEQFKTNYMYQIYAYVRSQERDEDDLSRCSTGVLLHPEIDRKIDEAYEIQGHVFRWRTVDLGEGSSRKEIERQLEGLIDECSKDPERVGNLSG